jgi:hypothetical protein
MAIPPWFVTSNPMTFEAHGNGHFFEVKLPNWEFPSEFDVSCFLQEVSRSPAEIYFGFPSFLSASIAA